MAVLEIVRIGEPALRCVASPAGDDELAEPALRVEDTRALTTWDGFERHHPAS